MGPLNARLTNLTYLVVPHLPIAVSPYPQMHQVANQLHHPLLYHRQHLVVQLVPLPMAMETEEEEVEQQRHRIKHTRIN